jgi:hypothetical protein
MFSGDETDDKDKNDDILQAIEAIEVFLSFFLDPSHSPCACAAIWAHVLVRD